MKRPHTFTFLVMVITALWMVLPNRGWAKVDDADCLTKVHRINQTIIKSGNKAIKKAQKESVREYAEMLMHEHSMVDEKALNILKSRNLSFLDLPVSTADEEMLKKLERTKEVEFDQVFMDEMVEIHQKIIADLDKETKLIGSEQKELQSFVDATLPLFQRHLDIAKTMLGTLRGKGEGNQNGKKDGKNDPEKE